jgi:hypothetical protein
MKSKTKRKSASPSKSALKPKKKSTSKKKAAAKSKTSSKTGSKPNAKMDDWLNRLSPKAQERIKREGYHLPVRSEQEQFENLSEDLQDAWAALRIHLLSLGEQELRTSHRSIMFARKTCYAFVRPKKKFIELNFFLPKALKSELIKKVNPASKTKWVHVMHFTHSDQVDWPLTDWILEAFEYSA